MLIEHKRRALTYEVRQTIYSSTKTAFLTTQYFGLEHKVIQIEGVMRRQGNSRGVVRVSIVLLETSMPIMEVCIEKAIVTRLEGVGHPTSNK